MRAIKNESAHVAYVLALADFAFRGSFGAYWLESASVYGARRHRWFA